MIIYKYAMNGIISVPKGSKLLKVGIQCNEIFVWFEITNGPPEVWRFLSVFSGQEFNEPEYKYLDTVFIDGFVYHVYFSKG